MADWGSCKSPPNYGAAQPQLGWVFRFFFQWVWPNWNLNLLPDFTVAPPHWDMCFALLYMSVASCFWSSLHCSGRDSGEPASMAGLITGERGIFRSLRSARWQINCRKYFPFLVGHLIHNHWLRKMGREAPEPLAPSRFDWLNDWLID